MIQAVFLVLQHLKSLVQGRHVSHFQLQYTSSSTEICLFLLQGLCSLSRLKVACVLGFFSTPLFVAQRASLCAYAP